MTLSVEGIAITASEKEVQRFFDGIIPGGDPIVKPLVSDVNSAFKSATVTFRGRTKAECKAIFEKLKEHHRTLRDGTGTSSTLDYGADFVGLTELANRCANDERPHFEYVLTLSPACLRAQVLQCLFCPWFGWSRLQFLPSQGKRSQKKQHVGSRYFTW